MLSSFVQPVAGLENILEAERRRLFGLCYRLTGSAADAEDIVQETFARAVERQDEVARAALRGWLVRVATHAALDVLRRRKREGYSGTWLPAPLDGDASEAAELVCTDTPELRYGSAESISFAFLVALERLTPRQRAVFVLREALGHSARETADVLGLSEQNVRLLHHRGRRAMQSYDAERSTRRAPADSVRRALTELVRCLLSRDAQALEKLLSNEVRSVTDGGGQYTALRKPLVGRARVARFHLQVARRRGRNARIHWCLANGMPAVLIEFADQRPRGAPRVLMRCELDGDGRIREIQSILADRKLSHVSVA